MTKYSEGETVYIRYANRNGSGFLETVGIVAEVSEGRLVLLNNFTNGKNIDTTDIPIKDITKSLRIKTIKLKLD